MNGEAEAAADWGPSAPAISALVDGVAAAFSADSYAAQIRAARQEFDHQRGRIFDDDETYALHMARFLEWYALERELEDERIVPVVHLLRRGALDGERELALAMARSHNSLFEVLASASRSLRLYDLVGSSFWSVRIPGPALGLEVGDIAEARLIPWRHEVALGPVVIFHPRAAREAIHRIVEARNRAGQLDQSLVAELAEMRLRFGRYRNMAIEHIYKEREPHDAGASRREGV